MHTDKTLLDLGNHRGTKQDSLPFLKFPSSRHLPTPDNEAELAELAKTLLSGSTDTKKLDEISSKINGFMTVQPEPGMCIKMKAKNGNKVFVNLCSSDKVPPLPLDVGDRELAEALQKSDESFRVPMSIGEPHDEADHSGQLCRVYDIAVNPSLFRKIENSELFYNFFLSLMMEALDDKYSTDLDRTSAITLKGKKVFGRILEQRIRTKPKLVTEVERPEENFTKNTADDAYQVPRFELWMDPRGADVRFLEVEVSLSNVVCASMIELLMGDKELKLTTSLVKPKNYRLHIFLPVEVSPELAESSFSNATKMMTMKVPLQPGLIDDR